MGKVKKKSALVENASASVHKQDKHQDVAMGDEMQIRNRKKNKRKRGATKLEDEQKALLQKRVSLIDGEDSDSGDSTTERFKLESISHPSGHQVKESDRKKAGNNIARCYSASNDDDSNGESWKQLKEKKSSRVKKVEKKDKTVQKMKMDKRQKNIKESEQKQTLAKKIDKVLKQKVRKKDEDSSDSSSEAEDSSEDDMDSTAIQRGDSNANAGDSSSGSESGSDGDSELEVGREESEGEESAEEESEGEESEGEESEGEENEGEESAGDDSGEEESSGEERESQQADSSEKNLSDEYVKLRGELADLPFEDLQKLKNKMGAKMFNQVVYGKGAPKPTIEKRANKNRPQEVSSKRPVKRFRSQQAKPERRVRDPRFDDLSGQFDEERFQKSYSFLTDIKDREKEKLKKLLPKEKNPEKKKNIQYLLNRMSQQQTTEQSKERSRQVKQKIRQTEKTDVAEGKTPFFLKKSELKKLELAERYRELKRAGKLDQYMSRKRRKLAQKDRKKLPPVS